MSRKKLISLAFVIFTFAFVRFSFCQEIVLDTTATLPPQIKLTQVNIGGDDYSLKELQKSAGFKVAIISDIPEKLDVKFSGPITTKKISSTVFEVTLKYLDSEDAFDKWSKGKDAPYKVTFTVTVMDVSTSLKESKTEIFTFGKW